MTNERKKVLKMVNELVGVSDDQRAELLEYVKAIPEEKLEEAARVISEIGIAMCETMKTGMKQMEREVWKEVEEVDRKNEEKGADNLLTQLEDEK